MEPWRFRSKCVIFAWLVSPRSAGCSDATVYFCFLHSHWCGTAGKNHQSALKCLKGFRDLFFNGWGKQIFEADLFLCHFQVVTNTLHFPVISPSCRYVTAVALSPAFGLMATGSMDRSVNVWKIGGVGYEETGKYCCSWVCHFLMSWINLYFKIWWKNKTSEITA